MQDQRRERDGKMICRHPDKYLFWDAWTLGRRTKEGIAKVVRDLVVEGRGMRRVLEEGRVKRPAGKRHRKERTH